MNTSEVKQVIIIRKDLNMRKGKMCAQAAHASMAFLIKNGRIDRDYDLTNPAEIKQWLEEGQTKIVAYCDSEQELIDLYAAGITANLHSHIITDLGFTEFNGVPTRTCLAIGPNRNEDVDKITKNLKLL